MHIQHCTHCVIEHKEAAGLVQLLSGQFMVIDQVEYGREYLIHALHIPDPRVELRIHKQYPGHYVVFVGDSLQFLIAHELVVAFDLVSCDHPVLLLSRAGQKRDHYGLARRAEECEVGVRTRGVLFDLLPQEEVALELLPAGGGFVQHQWVVLEFLWRKERFHELRVGFLVGGDHTRPLLALFRKVIQK